MLRRFPCTPFAYSRLLCRVGAAVKVKGLVASRWRVMRCTDFPHHPGGSCGKDHAPFFPGLQ